MATGWSGESWGFWVQTFIFWIQTFIFFLSTLAAVVVIYYNGKQARVNQKQLREHMLMSLHIKQKSNMDLQKALRVVSTLNKNAVTNFYDKKYSRERREIIRALNHYDFFAIGVNNEVFDENLYKQLQFGIVTRLWDKSEEFINKVRFKTKPQGYISYEAFEKMARRWKDNPPNVTHPNQVSIKT